MAHYPVYLESADNMTMAHVLDLPGCSIRETSRAAALAQLPAAIRAYHAWLLRHGEPAPQEGEAITIEIAAEVDGCGPFAPGDAAALFPPDHAALSPQEMARLLRLLAYSRADLQALVGTASNALPDELLDWRPNAESFCIRRILRHIGNAEEWYVSRLVPPETLPAEWENDEELPLYQFLEMERCTAIARLEQLTADERARVSRPAHWTDHPDEEWTARKALRRFLEHEREHTAQIRQVLAARRRHLLAHLAAARGELLQQLICLDEKALTMDLVNESWTAQDALVHIAAWDRWVRREIGRLVAGEEPDAAAVSDINAYNAANVAAWKGRSLEEVVAELRAARTEWIAWMKGLSEEEFFRSRPRGRGNWWLPTWIEVLREHDLEEHAHKLAEWRKGQRETPSGPRAILAAALEAGREELCAAADIVPPGERALLPVCGTWTLQDVLGHVADWEDWVVAGLHDMAAGRAPHVRLETDEETWNQEHAAARRGQSWKKVWADLQGTRRELLDILAGMNPAAMEHTFPGVWDQKTIPYAWFLVALAHDREHARGIRETMAGRAGPATAGPAKTFTQRG